MMPFPALLMVGILLIVNLLFYVLNSSVPPLPDSASSADQWQLQPPPLPVAVDIEQLLVGGAWGVVQERTSTEPETGDQSPEGLAVAEAAQLREPLRGIVRQGSQWRVLIERDGELVGLGPQDPLADSRWLISAIQADRLQLVDGNEYRTLLLFAPPDITDQEPTEHAP